MKLKKNFKILLMFGIMLGVMLFLGTTKVQADSYYSVVTEGNPTANSLDNIDTTLKLDMKEVKYENLKEIIFNKISEELKKDGIVVKDIEWGENDILLSINIEVPSSSSEGVYIDKISVSFFDYGNQKTIVEKDINIEWSNKSSYNENDKKYVENLINNINLPKDTNGDYELTKYIELGKEKGSRVADIIEVLKKEVNDSSIEFIPNGMGSGGGDLFSGGGHIGLSVFKDGIYYMNIAPMSSFQYQITVPNNIGNTDTDYINYSIPKIQSYLKTNEKITLEKISGYWYKVYTDGQFRDNIIIRKQEGTPIGNNIFVNNLPINVNVTVIPKENDTMEKEIKNKGYNKILASYELTLTGTDKLESPIDITFNVGTEHNGKTVYILHQKKNGNYENFEKKVDNGKVTVTVSELSPFILGIKEDTPTTDSTPKVDKGEKDETPKTGTVDIIGYVLGVTLLTGVGIVELKKRLK